jgi:hypothetical protein
MTIGFSFSSITNCFFLDENELEKERNFMMTSLHPPSSIYLFGKDLSDYNRKVQFLLTATAVLVFHVAQGYIQV